jgi:hypothetical protein
MRTTTDKCEEELAPLLDVAELQRSPDATSEQNFVLREA